MMAAISLEASPSIVHTGHAVWIRIAHWLIVASVLTLIYSGVAILMAHPRFYWGQAGNSLTKPIVELPLGPNYHNVKFGPATQFYGPNGPISRPRLADVYNLNSWARSLHFIVAWALSFSLGAYLAASLLTGHLRRWLLPTRRELSPATLGADIKAHLWFPLPQTTGGPPYNPLQKLAYLGVALVGLPVMVVTGLAMSPAVTAACPILMDITGGYQSARLLHFSSMGLIVAFLFVHLVMMGLTGFARQLRAMTTG